MKNGRVPGSGHVSRRRAGWDCGVSKLIKVCLVFCFCIALPHERETSDGGIQYCLGWNDWRTSRSVMKTGRMSVGGGEGGGSLFGTSASGRSRLRCGAQIQVQAGRGERRRTGRPELGAAGPVWICVCVCVCVCVCMFCRTGGQARVGGLSAERDSAQVNASKVSVLFPRRRRKQARDISSNVDEF
ncbi:hypothetical protein LX36DRAFT_388139 [Colletotrichum falcatum]|nr:hypothetical protein LX36DRAFT_388139 [Colletotrichum falcatum]